MEVIIQGQQSSEQVVESLLSIVRMFSEHYGIEHFRQVHLSMTLVDNQGDDIELVDSQTQEVFRVFEISKPNNEPRLIHAKPYLKLVVDNTR